MADLGDVLNQLMAVVQQRRREMPPDSYTTRLFSGGAERIGAKVREEAEETAEAAGEAGDEGRAHFVYEVGDLLYHLLVLTAWREVSLEEVADELARRQGLSGLEEKRRRTAGEEEQR